MALTTLCKFSAIASSQVSSRKFLDGISTRRYVSGSGQSTPSQPNENAVAQLLKKIMDTIKSNDVVKDIQQKIGIPPQTPPPQQASQVKEVKQNVNKDLDEGLSKDLSAKDKGRK